MNIIEPESNSLISLYKQRLSTLGSTISTLHTKISLDPTVALLQSNNVLQKYHKQRINELVKQIIDDERELILISCLEQYHKLKLIIQQTKSIQQISSNNNQQKKQYVQVINKKESQLLQLNSQLSQSKQQIKQLKSELNNSTLQAVSSEHLKSFEIEKLSLQSVTNSLTFENHRLVEDNIRLRQITKELEYQIVKKEQKGRQQIDDLVKQVKKLSLQNQEKTKELQNTKSQLKQAEGDSLTQKIYLSDKFSQLPRNRSLHNIKPNTRYLPRNKFRVAQFQQLCYQMSKQEQQLRNIRSNFAKFGQMLQRGVKSNLQNMRKSIIGLKSIIQNQVKESKAQMIKFSQIFETKASKILANQRITQTQKMERMKNLYQEQKILMQQKMKMEQIEAQKKIKDAELKIKDERIDQLQIQINNIKQVQNQYKQLIMEHQMLQTKLRLTSQPSSHRIKLESPRSFSPPPLDRLQISPPTNPSVLNHSKSLSPKTIIKNYAPSSPQAASRAHFNSLQYSRQYNPQLQFESDNIGKDSRTRKQLQNGFNELEQQIQAIIEREEQKKHEKFIQI